jgi:ribose transport system substrate-binding protein
LGLKGDAFDVTMACGAQAEAAKEGANIQVVGADTWSVAAETPIVQSVMASKPDGVLVIPTDSKAMIAPLKAMSDAGIKVTLVDSGLDDLSFATSFITSNNTQGGELAAKTLAQLIGDKGSVFIENSVSGATTMDARIAGFTAEMKNHPNITTIPIQLDGGDPSKATSTITSMLAAHPDLAGVFATNLQSAEGIATGLNQAGAAGKVKVVSFDAGAKQIEDLKNGIVQALIAQDPYTIGVDGVQQTILALNGQPTTPLIKTDLAAITQANMTDPAIEKYFYAPTCS